MSGSRLTARWRVGDDGSREPAGWQDTVIGAPCTFGRAADGVERCLPGGDADPTTAVYFGDAGCVQPLVRVAPGCVVPSHTQASTGAVCGAGAYVYLIGPVVTPPAAVYRLQGGACTSIVNPVGVWHAAAEVAPASMVASQIQIGP